MQHCLFKRVDFYLSPLNLEMVASRIVPFLDVNHT